MSKVSSKSSGDMPPADPVVRENLQDGWLYMEHPGLENSVAAVTTEAFEEVWSPGGWVIAAEENAVPAPPEADLQP
jgi:hypothetical protein